MEEPYEDSDRESNGGATHDNVRISGGATRDSERISCGGVAAIDSERISCGGVMTLDSERISCGGVMTLESERISSGRGAAAPIIVCECNEGTITLSRIIIVFAYNSNPSQCTGSTVVVAILLCAISGDCIGYILSLHMMGSTSSCSCSCSCSCGILLTDTLSMLSMLLMLVFVFI